MILLLRLKKYYYFVPLIPLMVMIITSLNLGNFACHYKYIDKDHVWPELARKVMKNITHRNAAVCDYASILHEQSVVDTENLSDMVLDATHIKLGGEYVPQDCKPLFSTAIIVPYRDRDRHLKDFLTHMHLFLRKQNIHYRIYVVEQDDTRPFNRAKLLNIGSVTAIRHGFPCIILHDVDLLPFVTNNIYACTKSPRHMSTGVDSNRFTLTYNELFGGVVAMLSEQFIAANGMSNSYYGWGAEDDDFYERLSKINLVPPVRFHPTVSAYIMMKHHKAPPSPERRYLLEQASQRFAIDGLNSLSYIEKSTKLHPLFTHIVVQL